MNILNLPIREKLEIILDVIKWNKEYCGRKWTFVNETHNRDNTKIYYYRCDKCGKVIEEHELR